MSVECHNCGTMNNEHDILCSGCEIEITNETIVSKDRDDVCENCEHFKPGQEIECQILAKKFNRNRIEIDCPETMSCEAYRRNK